MIARVTCLMMAVALVAMLSLQSAEAQNFRQLGTRRGAVAGAIIGGIVGNQNNEAFAGVVVGGLVGGVAGRVVGNNLDQRYYAPQQPVYQHQYYQQRPVYNRGYGAPVYHHGGHGGYHYGY